MSNSIKIGIAKEFRFSPTRSEKIMWNVLKNRQFLNLKFRRQHVIQGFIVDFYCHKLRLVIEIDGGIHKKQLKEDIERQKIIEDENINFFRIESKEVENNLNQVLNRLKVFIKKILK